MKKIYQVKTLCVKVWDSINYEYKFSQIFDPNPFSNLKQLEDYLKENNCKKGDEYYIDNPGIDTHRIIQ